LGIVDDRFDHPFAIDQVDRRINDPVDQEDGGQKDQQRKRFQPAGRELADRKKPDKDADSGKVALFILGVIVIAALILGIIQKTNFGVAHSLLPQTEGLQRVATIEDLSTYARTVTPPTQTFGAEFFIAGIYTQDHGTIPKDTVALVYTRDNYRYIEIDYLPNRLLEEQQTILGFYDQEPVVLTPESNGTIITLHNIPACLEPTETVPGKCKIQTQLIFQLGTDLVMFSTDGTHATKGELIEIAKSILNTDNE